MLWDLTCQKEGEQTDITLVAQPHSYPIYCHSARPRSGGNGWGGPREKGRGHSSLPRAGSRCDGE
jgi:hypothetical protein